jgi:choice-of-anchor B domain-containing protein
MSQVPLAEFGNNDANGNDCWGYVSPSGREYALMCMERTLGVVEITDPGNPVIVAAVLHPASLWGDVKVYQDFCYVVNESGGGMQIISLEQVDSGIVGVVGTTNQAGLVTAHNLAVNPDSSFLYTCGANAVSGLMAYDLADPANPQFAGAWGGSYVHDAVAVSYTTGPYAGREVVYCANGGAGLQAVDATDKANMFLIATRPYPGVSYAHQAWVSEDLRYLYLGDELDESHGETSNTRTLIFDIADPSNPILVSTFTSGKSSIDHNLYVNGPFIFEANYTTGLYVFDASAPLNPQVAGSYDTYPGSNSRSFNGAWSVFPFFPSDTVIVSDIQGGLFVFDVSQATADRGRLTFSYPQGMPELIDPAGGTLPVQIAAEQNAALLSDSAMLHVDVGGGFVAVPLDALGGDDFEATFPSAACGDTVRYYFSAQTTLGVEITDPPGAPQSVHRADYGLSQSMLVADGFEADSGWTVGAPDDNAVRGIWERVDPNGTPAQAEADVSADPGTQCWVTGQGTPGGSQGEMDVDGGKTTLFSPVLDLASAEHVGISYWRWFSNFYGATTSQDVFTIDISNDGGANWVNVETIGPDGDVTMGGWYYHEFRVEDFVNLTDQVVMRFVAADTDDAHVVEAGLDEFRVATLSCTAQQSCLGDIDGDGVRDLNDFTLFAAAYNSVIGQAHYDPAADLDADGAVDLSDFTLFANVYGQPCP